MTARGVWISIAIAAGLGAARGGTPPPGFVETAVWDGITLPTAAAYEPGTGNLWVLEKGGFAIPFQPPRVLVRDRTTGIVRTALSVPCVDAQGERGLLGIAFSPDYLAGPASRHVYLYYTRQITSSGACANDSEPAGARNRVVRYLESGGTLSGEEVLFETPYLTGATNHNGGTLRFGNDGTLFISIGDNDTDATTNPLSRDLSDPRGKLLRIRGDGSVPLDNPFVGQAGRLPQIWAWGLRNPFRFSIDPLSGAPFIADVGENTWEEIDRGIAGGDYGYPCFEGNAAFRTCNPAPASGSTIAPLYVYGHGGQTPPVSGNSVTGGPVYRATAFPASHRDRYYFADYGAGWIRSAAVDAGGALSDVQMFVPDAGQVVDLLVSPAGCLTYVLISGSVREVCFEAPSADQDGDGFTPGEGDCDDADATTYPGAPDLCDGADNNCSGTADDDLCSRYEADGQGRVDGVELAWIGRAFGSCSAAPALEWWFPVDYDLDGCVEGDDLAVLGAVWACAGAEPVCGGDHGAGSGGRERERFRSGPIPP